MISLRADCLYATDLVCGEVKYWRVGVKVVTFR